MCIRDSRCVEFSTPVTSFRSLQEGAYLLLHNLPVYDGGVVHHVPLLVALATLLQPVNYLIPFLYAGMDTLIAYQMMQLAKMYQRQLNMGAWIPGAIYAANPLVFLSCISQSTTLFVNLAISTSLLSALQGNYALASISISIAGYLSPYALLLVLPLAGICKKNTSRVLLQILLATILLQLISFKTNNDDWNYLISTYWTVLTLSLIHI